MAKPSTVRTTQTTKDAPEHLFDPIADGEPDDGDEPDFDAAEEDDDASSGSAGAHRPGATALGADEEQALILAAQGGDAAALDSLVRASHSMVTWTARRYRLSGVPLDDLVSEGLIGVLKAVERFDVARGYRFDTYARWWALDAMRSCVLNQSRVVRLPSHVVKEIGAMDRELKLVSMDPGSAEPHQTTRAVIDKVARRIKRSGEHVQRLMTLREPAVSLDGEEGTAHLAAGGSQGEGSITPEMIASLSQVRDRLLHMLHELDERERLVVRLRYGLDNGEGSTLQEVASTLGLTAERVRQIQRDALVKLRSRFIDEGLLDG